MLGWDILKGLQAHLLNKFRQRFIFTKSEACTHTPVLLLNTPKETRHLKIDAKISRCIILQCICVFFGRDFLSRSKNSSAKTLPPKGINGLAAYKSESLENTFNEISC